MTDPLLPCPFCAGESKLDYDSGNEVWGQSWKAGCPRCDIWTTKAMGSSTWGTNKKVDNAAKAAVTRAWNKRPQPPR